MKEFNGYYITSIIVTDSVRVYALGVTASLEELGSVERGDWSKVDDQEWVYLDQLPAGFGPGQLLRVQFIVKRATEGDING